MYGARLLGELEFKRQGIVFRLNQNVENEEWERHFGIIPLHGKREIIHDDLFTSLNLRLPIYLRNASRKKKLDYISKQKLKVASDRYELS